MKGIVQQTVKEVVDDLVSDGLVQFDKMYVTRLPTFSRFLYS